MAASGSCRNPSFADSLWISASKENRSQELDLLVEEEPQRKRRILFHDHSAAACLVGAIRPCRMRSLCPRFWPNLSRATLHLCPGLGFQTRSVLYRLWHLLSIANLCFFDSCSLSAADEFLYSAHAAEELHRPMVCLQTFEPHIGWGSMARSWRNAWDTSGGIQGRE